MKTLTQYIKEEDKRLAEEKLLDEKAGEYDDIIVFGMKSNAESFKKDIADSDFATYNDMELSSGNVFMSITRKEGPNAKKFLDKLFKKYNASSISEKGF